MSLTMRQGANAFAAVVLLVLGAGCERTEVVLRHRLPDGVTYERRVDTFAHGLIDGAAITAPCEPAVIETRRTAGDWLVGLMTIGVYTPRTVRVTCAADVVPLGGG